MKKKLIITLSIIAVLLLLSYMMKEKIKTKLVKYNENELGEPDKNMLLKKGSIGPEVSVLQRYLKEDDVTLDLGNTGPKKDGIDGFFGMKTEAGLIQETGLYQITLAEYEDMKNKDIVEAKVEKPISTAKV